MNGYDVEAQVEFEIGRLRVELDECEDKAEAFDIMQSLIDAYELRLEQLEERLLDSNLKQ